MNDDDKPGRPGPMLTEVNQRKNRGRLGRDVQSKIGQQLNHNAAVGRLQNQPIFIILGCHVLLFPGAG